MLIEPVYVSYTEFNKILKEYDGRIIVTDKPTEVGWNLNFFKDNQSNYHILYRDLNTSLKKEIHHLAFDPYDPSRRGSDVIKGEGRKAFKLAQSYCDMYGESLDFIENKNFVRYDDEDYNIVACMYHYVNRNLPIRTWHKHCYGYDMNSCYPYFMTKPLPYGEIVGRNRYVKEDELGFNFDLTVKGDTSFRMCFEGEFANIIFKKKVYRGLLDFVEYEYARKKTSTKEERDKHKLILNSLIGIMKYHNVFLRIAVLEYARMYIESLKDDNTIMQTVDSIVSLTPRPDLDIGDNLGQFKLEHEDESFIWITDSQKKWANSDTSKKGLKKARTYDNFQLVKPPYGFDFNKFKIVRQKEEWSRLWPNET